MMGSTGRDFRKRSTAAPAIGAVLLPVLLLLEASAARVVAGPKPALWSVYYAWYEKPDSARAICRVEGRAVRGAAPAGEQVRG